MTKYEKLLSEDMKDLKIRKEMEKQEQVQRPHPERTLKKNPK